MSSDLTPLRDRRFVMSSLLTGEDALGGAVSGENVYIAAYSSGMYSGNGRLNGSMLSRHIDVLREVGDRHPHQLDVGQETMRRFTLSGGSAYYLIRRVA